MVITTQSTPILIVRASYEGVQFTAHRLVSGWSSGLAATLTLVQIGIPIRIIDKTHVWVLHFRREDDHGNIPLLGGCGRCTATPRGSFAAHADVQAAWNYRVHR